MDIKTLIDLTRDPAETLKHELRRVLALREKNPKISKIDPDLEKK